MRAFLIICVLSLYAVGCTVQNNSPTQPTASDIVCLWIAADKDTYVSYGRHGDEADRNFGTHGSLVVSGAESITPNKISYVHFPSPILPAGTEVLEARLEVFMGGKNEDGTSDDILMSGGPMIGMPWDPAVVTWNTRPGKNLPAPGGFSIRLRSQNWCGSQNIAGYVSDMIANPGNHDGFALHIPERITAQKSFYSDNDIRRKQNDLGLSPRLLVRLRLPAGKTTNDISMPFLIPDTDLALPRPVLMVRFAQGPDWPQDWNAAPRFE